MKYASNLERDYLPIEDHAIIGNLHTVALVGIDGTIDWYCLPRFDSPSIFGAILDADKGGMFRLTSDDVNTKYLQIYLPETNVVLTRFITDYGGGELTDFMPIKEKHAALYRHTLVRSISGAVGTLPIKLTCRPAFNYARDQHHVELVAGGAIFHSHEFDLYLTSPVPLERDGKGGVTATFTLQRGESAHFQLISDRELEHLPGPLTETAYQDLLYETLHYWYRWLANCTYQGRWREMVQRSALVLKLLTYAPTGAIVAAPTTSLPETLGGSRNWDYRYSWLRDAAFTLDSLLKLGFTEEGEAFTGWLNERCHELKENGTLQPMYGITGEQDLKESTLDHLAGYRGSRPVRIGNGAYTQKQLDIYGELMDAIYIYHNYDAISYNLWQNLCRLLKWLSQHWKEPDNGIWEVRGGEKPFLHSRLMCWIAFDRALRIARDWGWPAPLSTWEQIRAESYDQIMQEGWNEQRNCFTQYYGSDAVDASALLLLLKHFTGPHEPRVVATIERIKEELTVGTTTVRRYDQKTAADDGMGRSSEGAFTACCFWMIENLARINKLEEARLRLEKLLSMSNHVGLYAEEISSSIKAVGNFPQAFSHLALITACYALDETLNTRKGWYWRE